MVSAQEQNLRAFICIDFPDEVIKKVVRIQKLISKKQFVGKLTELENLHLTLKFLGEIDEKTLNRIEKMLSEIKFPTLNLQLESVGTFSYGGNPKIVWIKVIGNLFELQKKIDSLLENLLPKEGRFMSHLTIARLKYVKDKKDFIDYISKIKLKPIKFVVNSFKLKSSELRPECPVYKTLKEFSAIRPN